MCAVFEILAGYFAWRKCLVSARSTSNYGAPCRDPADPSRHRSALWQSGSCRPADAGKWRLPRPDRTADVSVWHPRHHGFFGRKIIGWVVRHHHRKPGQGRSPSRRNYVRTPLVFVIPDCEILAKHCLPRTLSASTSGFNSSDEFSRMTSPHARKTPWTTKRASRILASSMCPVLVPQLRS